MKRQFLIIVSTAIFCLFLLPQGFPKTLEISDKTKKVIAKVDALTIFDCYKLALKQSEVIATKAELIKETEAHFLQALSVVMPSVSFVATQGRQDVVTAPSPRSSYERKFVFKQNLFSGFKEIAGISGSKLERSQRVNEKIRAEQLLFTDVSDAFYLFLEQQNDLKTLQMIRGVLKKRTKELKGREELGRSRPSERVSVQAQLYKIESEFELAKSRQDVARELLEFLIGVSIRTVYDSDNGFPVLSSEEYYVARASLRPDVEAAKQALEVAKKKVTIARSGFFPSVSLEGNYYTSKNTLPTNNKWDGLLKVDVPVFDWTQAAGDVKEANAKARESELYLEQTRRQAITDIRQAYANINGSIAQAKALRKALVSATTNYRLQEEDYRLSLVNNLDVLTAIQTLAETKRDFNHIFYETKRSYWQLRRATGETPNIK
jgi:outer membrane protein